MRRSKKLLVIVNLDNSKTKIHTEKAVLGTLDMLDRLSNVKDKELVFRSNDSFLFGYYVQTHAEPTVFRSEFDKLGVTRDGDDLQTVELSKTLNTADLSEASVWF